MHIGVSDKQIAKQAAEFEFGAPGTPARAFFRSTVRTKMDDWILGFVEALESGMPPEKALDLLGAQAVKDMKTAMADAPEAIRNAVKYTKE